MLVLLEESEKNEEKRKKNKKNLQISIRGSEPID